MCFRNLSVLLYCFLVCCGIGFCDITAIPPDIDSTNSAEEGTTSSLELLHVLFRHGPRTPVNTYPNDPYVNEQFYPFGWGHLTNDAKRELFALGSWLRTRYSKFLDPYYSSDLLHAQASVSPRTMMSLATVLASLFQPKGTPMEWDKNFNWQPVPIYSEPEDRDFSLRMTAKCPRYDQALEEVLQLPEVKAELTDSASLFKELSEITGQNVTGAGDVSSIFITLLAEQHYGLQLPAWTKDYFPHKMKFMAVQDYIYKAYTTEMRRIKGGPFVEKMFQQMQEKAAGNLKPDNRKMFLYCAHDWTITNILSALNVWKRQLPRFSALAAFELRKNLETGQHFVEIYFKNDPKKEPEKLTIPDCGTQCPLEKLVELYKDIIPNGSYEEMCRLKTT